MNWYNIHLRKLLLMLITSLQIALPIALSAAAPAAAPEISPERMAELLRRMPPERIEAIIAKAEAAEAKIDLKKIDALTAKVDNPSFLHKITHQREVWLEKIEAFNETPLVVFDEFFGVVPNFDPSPTCKHGSGNVHLGILAEDLLKPGFYLSSLLLDIYSMSGYFDGIIDIITNAIVQKEDVVLYNLNILLETGDPDLFATTFQNLHEALQKTMRHKDQMRRLAINFFKKRILPTCIEHAKKTLRPAPFIGSRAPEDANAPQKVPVVSIGNYLPVRFVLRPLIESAGEQVDLKLNAWISGYPDKRKVSLLNKGALAYLNVFPTWFSNVGYGVTDFILEFAKQQGFVGTMDESWWFTLGTELTFNLYFFHRVIDSMIEDQFLDLMIKQSISLKESIEKFERQLARPQNASQEKQAEIRQLFVAEVHFIVKQHLGPSEPILLEKMRSQHTKLKTITSWAILAPATYSLLKPVIDIIKGFIP